MKNYKILILILLLFNNSAFGANAWVDEQINQILVHDDGSENFSGQVHVTMMSEMSWIPACVNTNAYKKIFVLDLSRGAASAQYSTLLAAKISGKPVTIQINDACINGLAMLRNVSISGQ